MAYMHGVYQLESDTPIMRPREADSALPVYVGTFPAHRLEDPSASVNVPFIWYGYNEAVADVGMVEPELWQDMPGAAFIDSQLRLHGIVPAAGINVWDPTVGALQVADIALPLINGVAVVDDPMAMISSLKILYPEDCERGIDYTLKYQGPNLMITRIDSGKILPTDTSVTITYKRAVLPSDAGKKEAVIGGIDESTNKRTGIELIEEIWLRFQKVPGFVLAERSTDPEIGAFLNAKAKNINGGNFECIALVDLPADTPELADYRKIPEWKVKNALNDSHSFGHWPCVALGNRVYPLSVRAAGKYGEIDADNNGRPYVQISNKTLAMTKMCQPDGTELSLLNQPQANFLNENGIGTVINDGGWRFWDTETMAMPLSGDIKETDRAVRRMFCWAKNTVNLTIKSKVDMPVTKLLVDSVLHTVNGYFDSLASEGAILGGRVEFLRADNENLNILGGRLYFRIYFTPSPTARAYIFDWQYDPDYLDNLWVA